MQKVELKYASHEDPDLLIWKVPFEFTVPDSSVQVYAIPLLGRSGGMLLAIPAGVFTDEVLLDAAIEEEGVLGPSREFDAGLLEEDDNAVPQEVGQNCTFLVIDCTDAILADLRRYDPVTDSTEDIRPFSSDRPLALPALSDVIGPVKDWIEVVALQRTTFYSAREEQEATPKAKALPKKAAAPKKISNAVLADQVASLTEHMKLLATQQEEIIKSHQAMLKSPSPAGVAPGLANGPTSKRAGMPALSSALPIPKAGQVPAAAKLIGPPPKVRAAVDVGDKREGGGGDEPVNPMQPEEENPLDFAKALTQQSAAITALVAHLTTGDAMVDLSSSSSGGPGLNTKGAARREKMQSDLASRQSNFFLQVQQQLFKRMNPTRQVPTTEAELATSGTSMTNYLERYGGFKGNRETGLALWIAAHVMDAMAVQDFHGAKEYMALMTVALEQSALDGGWQLAYLLCLLEDPPNNLFADRMTPITSGRPFAPLVLPSWSAVALSYLKEVDLLSSRKQEVRTPKGTSSPKSSQTAEGGDPPKPKNRPRFPKKAKAAEAS